MVAQLITIFDGFILELLNMPMPGFGIGFTFLGFALVGIFLEIVGVIIRSVTGIEAADEAKRITGRKK